MAGERDAHPGCLRPTFPRTFGLGTMSLCHPLPTELPTVVLRPRLLEPLGALAEGVQASWLLTMLWT